MSKTTLRKGARTPTSETETSITGTAETRPSRGTRRVIAAVAGVGLTLSALTACDGNQPNGTPTLEGPSPVASAPQTPGTTAPATPDQPPQPANTPTAAASETDNGPAGDKPTTEDEFRQLLADRGYVVGGQTTVWFDSVPDALAFQYGSQANNLSCGANSFELTYLYSTPGSDGLPDGSIAWTLAHPDADGNAVLNGPTSTLPDCSTLA
jgi:hypothetical protein